MNKICNGKNCYTKGNVKKAMRAIMKARNVKLRSYECNKCFMYHLTKQINSL